MRILVLLLSTALIISCTAGKFDYIRPTPPQGVANFKVIDRTREAVWNSSVPELGKHFFVINNLDKSSGLINVSYSGDPERYIDCGRVTSSVKDTRGERIYDFPAARAEKTYEVVYAHDLFIIERKMSVEGRINLVFEENGPNSTKVTASTRYVVTKHVTQRNVANNFPMSRTDSISFNSGGGAAFPPSALGAVDCVSTGELEREILLFIK